MNPLKRWIVRKEVEGFVDNAIKESQMSDQMKRWLIGAVNALASGLFATGGAGFAGASMKQTLIIAGFAAVGSFGKWMVQHPLPGGAE